MGGNEDLGGEERTVWRGTPSQWGNILWFLACLLLIPIPFALWRWLDTRSTVYTLTDQRLTLRSGVLSRSTDDIELYRIKDTRLEQGVLQRLVGLGTIVLVTSDTSMPTLLLPNIAGAEAVREQIRLHVERRRDAKGVREMDLGRESL